MKVSPGYRLKIRRSYDYNPFGFYDYDILEAEGVKSVHICNWNCYVELDGQNPLMFCLEGDPKFLRENGIELWAVGPDGELYRSVTVEEVLP